MHTVELLEQAIRLAQAAGYEIRQEWLDGSGGGHCQVAGKKTIFLDLSQDAADHLACIIESLTEEPGLLPADVPPELNRLLRNRRAA